jgi:hypothetical protein
LSSSYIGCSTITLARLKLKQITRPRIDLDSLPPLRYISPIAVYYFLFFYTTSALAGHGYSQTSGKFHSHGRAAQRRIDSQIHFQLRIVKNLLVNDVDRAIVSGRSSWSFW